jgi:hypothetical protein
VSAFSGFDCDVDADDILLIITNTNYLHIKGILYLYIYIYIYVYIYVYIYTHTYRCADKSLARPGRKQFIATEDLSFIYPIYNHNWRNISTIYLYRMSREECARLQENVP